MTPTTHRPQGLTTRTLRVRPFAGAAAGGLALAAVLAGCGGGSTASSTTSGAAVASGPRTVLATGAAAAPGQGGQAGQDGGSGQGRPDDAQFAKIRECLTAAGISLPNGGPGGPADGNRDGNGDGGQGGPPPGGGMTTGADGRFTAPDGDVYTAMPTPGADGRGPGDGDGPGVLFSDPAVAAALKACGLAVPTAGNRPSATPTS